LRRKEKETAGESIEAELAEQNFSIPT